MPKELANDNFEMTVRRLDSAVATLVAGRGRIAELRNALKAAYDVDLADGPRVTADGRRSFIGIGPGRWLVVRDDVDGEQLLSDLMHTAGAAASICDQSGGYVVFELSGEQVSDTLAKMMLIDIHALEAGQAVTTAAALIGVTLWRPDNSLRFRIAGARSYEDAFSTALASASGM